MMRVVFETCVAYPTPRYRGLANAGNGHGVLAVALHPQRQGFNTLQQLKRALR